MASVSDLTNQLCICCGRSGCYHLDNFVQDPERDLEWNNSCPSLNGTDITNTNSGSNLNLFIGAQRRSPSIPNLYQNGNHINGNPRMNREFAYTSSNSVLSTNNNGDMSARNNFVLRKKGNTEPESDTKGRFQFSNNGFYIEETTMRNAEAML